MTDPAAAVAASGPTNTADVVAALEGGSGARPDTAADAGEGSGSPGELGPIDPLDIPGEIISEYSLVEGDCFNRFEGLQAGRRLAITARIGCDEPHWGEVYHTFELDAPAPAIYPGDDAVRGFALRVCYEQFEAFVGEIYELSVYDIGVFTAQSHELRARGGPLPRRPLLAVRHQRRIGVGHGRGHGPMTGPADPVLERRQRLARLARTGRRLGYSLYGVSLARVRRRLPDRLHHPRPPPSPRSLWSSDPCCCCRRSSSATASARPTGPTATTTGSPAMGWSRPSAGRVRCRWAARRGRRPPARGGTPAGEPGRWALCWPAARRVSTSPPR